ncbi:hypothetical protein DWU98_02975 [Dyella monticola]|uniref:Uncharacterized protein n=1 Tax=Dyella monticola TaxID=1927958 RepID=A0A370X9I0_9GAMM|nr:hypothetical protein [Dyella monticola]RDS84930.1 hypothetical protein DWU98_02975 [Dyella monticola]
MRFALAWRRWPDDRGSISGTGNLRPLTDFSARRRVRALRDMMSRLPRLTPNTRAQKGYNKQFIQGILMSNIIRFLERIGSQAHWGEASEEEMELALANAEVEGPLHLAVMNKDVAQLQVLLQQKPLVGFVIPGEEEEEEEGEEEPDEKDGPKDMQRASVLSVASQQ